MNKNLNTEIQDFRKQCSEMAKDYMQTHGVLPMCVLFLCQDNDKNLRIVMSNEINELHRSDTKSEFINAVTNAISLLKPVALAMITEAWMTKKPLTEKLPNDYTVSEDSNKEEIVSISVETYNSVYMEIYDIIRHTNGDIELTIDPEISAVSQLDKSKVHGRYTHLLQENYDKYYKELVENSIILN